MKFDLAEDATHFSNQCLVTVSLDGVVSEKADAVCAVGKDVIVLSGAALDAEDIIHCRA